MLYFSGCTIDVAARVLTRDGGVEHLEPQAFDVLVHLLENGSRVVPKSEFLDTIWGGHWVSESALATRIKEIRRATGDTGNAQRVVRTVRGRGYQLVARVTEGAKGDDWHEDLVGRLRDLGELDGRLQPGALVTLVGPGGVGKTTLARRLVSMAEGRFTEGAFAIDLTVLDHPSQLRGAVARATRTANSSDSGFSTTLGTLDAVLLLDDADDFVPEVAQLCAELIESGGPLAVVVTSRERLCLPREQVWPVLPLSASAARQLLETRARALAPLGGLQEADPDDLDSLSTAVDRLPLALEMLAGMSAMLSIDDLRDLVEARLDLITSAHRGTPPRHQSLERLVTGSIDRLDGRATRALMALTSFAGAFSPVDAAAVVSQGDAGLSLIRELSDRSLLSPVVSPDGPQLQMLRTVRRAVVRRANADELVAAAQRHAETVTNVLERADTELRGPAEAHSAAAFERLADEARAAHAWARLHDRSLAVRLTAALHLYAYSRMWVEPAQWAAAISGDEAQSGEVLAALASQSAQEGRLLEANRIANGLLDHPSSCVRGWALEVLSDVGLYQGELERAREHSQSLITLGADRTEPRMIAIGVTNAALSWLYQGRPDEALQLVGSYDKALTESCAPSERAWLALALGEALAEIDVVAARRTLTDSVRLGNSVGNRFVAGVATSELTRLQAQQGDLEGAARSYIEVLGTFLRQGNVTHLTTFLRNMVPLLASLGEPAAAAVVGGWVLGPSARPSYGPDGDAVLSTLADLRASEDAGQMERWAEQAHELSAPETAEIALAALRRHA